MSVLGCGVAGGYGSRRVRNNDGGQTTDDRRQTDLRGKLRTLASIDPRGILATSGMADAARAQRAAALEEKRRRLEELKKQRARRNETQSAAPRVSATGNLDEYIDGLLGQPGASAVDAVSTTDEHNQERDHAESIDQAHAPSSTSTDANEANTTTNNVIAQPAPALPPKVVETFTVSTQTDNEEVPEQESQEDHDDEDHDATKNNQKQTRDPQRKEQHAKDQSLSPQDDLSTVPRLLSSKEIEKEVSSKPFSSFLNSTSKKVERLLGIEAFADLLVDYVGEDDRHKDETRDADANRFVTSSQVYQCQKWTESRDITDIDWNATHREHILATYHMSKSYQTNNSTPLSRGSAAVKSVSPNDTLSSSLTPRSGELQSDGLALIWSLAMPTRPEHIFTCGSPVTTGRFHPTDSTLVVGGCESGQLVVWDTRAGRLPVQKSTLTSVTGASSKSHIYPINGMEVIEGGAALVTSSTDGRVNFWSLGNLREPVESTTVGESVSCFAVAPESESLLLGDAYGSMYTVQSSQQQQQPSGRSSSRKQVRKLATINEEGDNVGHFGLITSLSCKLVKKPSTSRVAGLHKGFLRGSGGLILSSGVDWTVKLWSPAYSDLPLASFVSHSYDYMSDAKWSPSHPSLFATSSSNGTVGLWDLSSSLDEPITGQDGITIDSNGVSGSGLSELRWSVDGRRLSVASGDQLHVLTLTEDVTQPKGDEDNKMMNHLMSRGLIAQQ